MNFKDIDIKDEYRSLQDDMVKDFYNPLLKVAKKYQRAVGFFSSSALIEISKGISGLIQNGGTIELIASPKLSEEDVNAIEQGLAKREEIITGRIIESIEPPKNKREEQRLDLLINLIANGKLEIKIIILEKDNKIGMYHEKMGILTDNEDNIIAFSGSMNESTTAFMHNYESIDVFCSWADGKEANRALKKARAFNAMWNNYEPYVEVMNFPEASKQKLFQYRSTNKIEYIEDDANEIIDIAKETDKRTEPKVPDWVKLREYQKLAIDNWGKQNYKGIFDMATGTGKTYTGLAAIARLYKERKAPIAILIVCPYQHLVMQWVEDIVNYGMKPVICYSTSPQKNWLDRLKDSCMEIELELATYFCAVFTNATFTSDKVQKVLEGIKNQALIVVDEAHNFGAENLSRFLDREIPYRLALSATLDRYGDEVGTKKLYEYFGEKCIEYSLKEAIEKDMLVHYYYHPVIVNFEEDELEEYLDISRKIGVAIMSSQGKELSSSAKILLIKRARIVASARQKVKLLVEEMEEHKDENHMLIYCGATTMKDAEYDENRPPEEEKKQVDFVMDKLGNILHMKVAKFTSEENVKEREQLKKEFDEGSRLQALIAIRCLDEGVNIPSIQKAFILASSTNPKEYIQRRGRVLRKFPGKKYADIYDFVLCPLPINNVNAYDEETIRLSRSLVKKEIERMQDFANLADNPSVADKCIYSFIEQYDINMEEESEDEQY